MGLFHPSFNPIDLHSFPSDHAAFLVPLVCTLGSPRSFDRRRDGPSARLRMLARVWMGLHYPSDILAGAMIGSSQSGWSTSVRNRRGSLGLLDWARSRWPVRSGWSCS